MHAMKKLWTTLLIILLSVALGGCGTIPHRDETASLLKHPEFYAAAKAAPNFVKDALRTVTQLEYELEQASK